MSELDNMAEGEHQSAPIFIIGTERSGSNLLRLMLNAHSRIAAPHPPHFMAYFGHLADRYGDLDADENFERLIDDLLAHVNGHIHPWPFVPCRQDLLNLPKPRSILSASYSFYDQYAERLGKSRWACKSTFMIHYCDQILGLYPKAKLIWLVRDPRDVALSSTTSVFNPFHPFYTAQLWRDQQQIGLAAENRLPGSVIRRIRYEDLVLRPAETLLDLCRFLDIPLEEAMFDYFSTPEAVRSSSLSQDWKNTRQPILRNNTGKFVFSLSQAEVSVIEHVAGPTMKALGYSPACSGSGRPAISGVDRISFRIRNEVLRMRAEYRSVFHDRNGIWRWRRAVRMKILVLRLHLRRLKVSIQTDGVPPMVP